jgi:hypothetical protein
MTRTTRRNQRNLDEIPRTRNQLNDTVAPFSFDNSRKRRRKEMILRAFLALIAIATVAFLAVRITRLTACAEEGGFFASTDCGGISACCEIVTPVVSHNRVTIN